MFCKAQMSAPFELLVAVILMTFVILIGMQAMSVLEDQQCVDKTKTSLNAFAAAIEKAVNQNQINSYVFSLPACYQSYKLTLETRDDKTICSEYCGGTKSLCKIFRFEYTRNGGQNFLIKCVNIPVDTTFNKGPSCATKQPNSSEWGPTVEDPCPTNPPPLCDFGDDAYWIIENAYYFYPVTTGQLFPEVCVFKRTGQ